MTNARIGWVPSHGSLVRYRPWARKLKTANETIVDNPPVTMKRPISTTRWGRRGGTRAV